MPNLNAALGVAQMEKLPDMLDAKRAIADRYAAFFADCDEQFVRERTGVTANYWLNAILTDNRSARDEWLAMTNEAGVMTRPAWELMPDLPMYRQCQHGGLENARWLQDRLVNIPSSVPDGWIDKQ
jgi:dTDP-4-amino-4,6-dideoxygalactose transaminase